MDIIANIFSGVAFAGDAPAKPFPTGSGAPAPLFEQALIGLGALASDQELSGKTVALKTESSVSTTPPPSIVSIVSASAQETATAQSGTYIAANFSVDSIRADIANARENSTDQPPTVQSTDAAIPAMMQESADETSLQFLESKVAAEIALKPDEILNNAFFQYHVELPDSANTPGETDKVFVQTEETKAEFEWAVSDDVPIVASPAEAALLIPIPNTTQFAESEVSSISVSPLPDTPTQGTQTPVTQTPVTQTPVTQTPVTQTPVTQTPVTQTPVTQTPVAQTPVAQTPVAQTPVAQTPVAQTQVAQTQVAQTPVTQTPVTQTPVTQTPATQTPATQTPATQTPATQTPVTQTPVTQTPVTQTPVTQTPVTQTTLESIVQTLNETGELKLAPHKVAASKTDPALKPVDHLSDLLVRASAANDSLQGKVRQEVTSTTQSPTNQSSGNLPIGAQATLSKVQIVSQTSGESTGGNTTEIVPEKIEAHSQELTADGIPLKAGQVTKSANVQAIASSTGIVLVEDTSTVTQTNSKEITSPDNASLKTASLKTASIESPASEAAPVVDATPESPLTRQRIDAPYFKTVVNPHLTARGNQPISTDLADVAVQRFVSQDAVKSNTAKAEPDSAATYAQSNTAPKNLGNSSIPARDTTASHIDPRSAEGGTAVAEATIESAKEGGFANAFQDSNEKSEGRDHSPQRTVFGTAQTEKSGEPGVSPKISDSLAADETQDAQTTENKPEESPPASDRSNSSEQRTSTQGLAQSHALNPLEAPHTSNTDRLAVAPETFTPAGVLNESGNPPGPTNAAGAAGNIATRANVPEQLLQSIEDYVETDNLKSIARNETVELRMKLNPVDLGEVVLLLSQSADAKTASILVGDDVVRHLVESGMEQIETSLRELGFDSVEVDIFSRSSRDDRFQQAQRDRAPGQQKEKSSEAGNHEAEEHQSTAGDAATRQQGINIVA